MNWQSRKYDIRLSLMAVLIFTIMFALFGSVLSKVEAYSFWNYTDGPLYEDSGGESVDYLRLSGAWGPWRDCAFSKCTANLTSVSIVTLVDSGNSSTFSGLDMATKSTGGICGSDQAATRTINSSTGFQGNTYYPGGACTILEDASIHFQGFVCDDYSKCGNLHFGDEGPAVWIITFGWDTYASVNGWYHWSP